MITQVTELAGRKSGIKIQVSWFKGRILSFTLQGGMRTAEEMDRKTKPGHGAGSGQTWKVCTMHNIPWYLRPWLRVRGQAWSGPWIMCMAKLLWILALSASQTQWTLFFPSNQDTPQLTPTPQTTLLLPNLPVIAWAQPVQGWPLGSCLPVTSVMSTAVGSQEKLTERWVGRQGDKRECQSPWRAAFCLCPPSPCPQRRQHYSNWLWTSLFSKMGSCPLRLHMPVERE